MRVIVIAATKGGVGKTTIAAALGVEAVRRGRRAVLVDVDPQQSLRLWHDERAAESPAIAKADRYIDRTLEELRRQSWDLVIVDTPPGIVSITEPAVQAADLVVIPVRASPIDVHSLDAICDMVAVHDKPFVFVLNATVPRSKLAEGARMVLEKAGEVLTSEVANRLLHASAMISGRTAAEADPGSAAAAEIASLYREIDGHLARPSKQPVKVGRS